MMMERAHFIKCRRESKKYNASQTLYKILYEDEEMMKEKEAKKRGAKAKIKV